MAAHPLPHGPSGRGTDSPSARHKDVKARAYLAGVSENAGQCYAARWPFATAEIMLPPQLAATVGGAEWGSPGAVDIGGGLPGGPAERMLSWQSQEDHSRRSTGLRPLTV